MAADGRAFESLHQPVSRCTERPPLIATALVPEQRWAYVNAPNNARAEASQAATMRAEALPASLRLNQIQPRFSWKLGSPVRS